MKKLLDFPIVKDEYSGVMVRAAHESDLPALEWDGEYTYLRRVFHEAYERMENGLSIMWLLDLPGTGIIGQAFVQLICGRPELADGIFRAYIYSFRVKPGFRNLGLGSMLLDFIETYLYQRGFRLITLNVAKENVDAFRLYQKHGYRVVAHEPGEWSYEDDKGVLQYVHEPAWRMEKSLVK
jgi:ribosomal protein S18 acetylase RimI-like enzyme